MEQLSKQAALLKAFSPRWDVNKNQNRPKITKTMNDMGQ